MELKNIYGEVDPIYIPLRLIAIVKPCATVQRVTPRRARTLRCLSSW